MAISHSTNRLAVGAAPFLSSRPVCAWSAAEARRIDIVGQRDVLIVQRTEALVDMRRSARDLVRFSAASKREAELAARVRRLRGEGGRDERPA